MRVVVTGASGLVGGGIVDELKSRGEEVVVCSRSPGRAAERLGVSAIGWDPSAEPAPAEALGGADAVIHLAGESVSQRWNDEVKRRIRSSRIDGTRNIVRGIAALAEADRPGVLVCASATGFYGHRGDEPLNEGAAAGGDFLARVCVDWEHEAAGAQECGLRVAMIRTGLVLDAGGGALAKMLPPFKLGAGGPAAGGRQYVSWIHADDLVALYLRAAGDDSISGPVNGTAPNPVTNKEFSRTLGRVLHRPAFAPVPEFALRVLYGEMAELITRGQRALPARAEAAGFAFRHPQLEAALRDALE